VIIAISGWRGWPAPYEGDVPSSSALNSALFELSRRATLGEDLTVRVGDCPTGVDLHVREMIRQSPRLRGEVWPALWHVFGSSAGPERNRAMLLGTRQTGAHAMATEGQRADALWAFPHEHHDPGRGSGTWSAIRIARELGIPVTIRGWWK
jgi:hypothetical protein